MSYIQDQHEAKEEALNSHVRQAAIIIRDWHESGVRYSPPANDEHIFDYDSPTFRIPKVHHHMPAARREVFDRER